MKFKLSSMILVAGVSLLSGCVAYTPYPNYDDDYSYAVPAYQGGWRHRAHHHHHHHRRHHDD